MGVRHAPRVNPGKPHADRHHTAILFKHQPETGIPAWNYHGINTPGGFQRGGEDHLGCQDVEVPRAVGPADEFALVLGRHPRVLGHPHDRRGEAVAVEAVAVESLALLLPIALTCREGGRKGGERGSGSEVKSLQEGGVGWG